MKKLKKILNYPCPYIYNSLFEIVLVCVVINAFVLMVKPSWFYHEEDANLIIIGFGVVSIIGFLFTIWLTRLVYPKFLNEEGWTIKKQFIHYHIIVLVVAVLSYYYAVVIDYIENGWAGLWFVYVRTLLPPLIPITIFALTKHSIELQRHLREALEISNKLADSTTKVVEQNETLDFTIGTFQCSSNSIIYIESDNNCINIHYLQNEQIQVKQVRNTLKNVEGKTENFSNFMRVHRAFIVNMSKVRSVSGNAQGLRIKFCYTNNIVPVSRSYTQEFRSRI